MKNCRAASEAIGHEKRFASPYQGRFKAIVIEADAYLTELSRYVHLNPVRIPARRPAAEERLQTLKRYRWSSLAGYVNKQQRSPVVTYALV